MTDVKIVSVTEQYLKLFNCVQIKLLVWAILKTTSLCENEWLILNKIISII